MGDMPIGTDRVGPNIGHLGQLVGESVDHVGVDIGRYWEKVPNQMSKLTKFIVRMLFRVLIQEKTLRGRSF